MTPTPDPLGVALRDVPTIKALTGRLGTFNDAWWDRFAADIRAALAAQPAPPLDDLGAAWAEAEALTIGKGWDLFVGHTSACRSCVGWWATASERPTAGAYPNIVSSETGRPRGEHHDDSPAAALHALAAALSEPKP